MGNCIRKKQLLNIDSNKVEKFVLEDEQWVKVCNVYDGDTVTIITYFRGKPYKFQLRMSGYDCPEMKPPLSQEDRALEIEAARSAKSVMESLVNNKILKMKFLGWDKYGRVLGKLYLKNKKCVNDLMVEYGWGMVYSGGKKVGFEHSKWKPRPIPY